MRLPPRRWIWIAGSLLFGLLLLVRVWLQPEVSDRIEPDKKVADPGYVQAKPAATNSPAAAPLPLQSAPIKSDLHPISAPKPHLPAEVPEASSPTRAPSPALDQLVARYGAENLKLPALLSRRQGHPVPEAVWALLDLRQTGATLEEQRRFVREHFGPDLSLKAWTMAWLTAESADTPSQAQDAAKKKGPPIFRLRALKRLEPIGR